jgi:CTP:phosphocholine cytidylyltransferase-like protein
MPFSFKQFQFKKDKFDVSLCSTAHYKQQANSGFHTLKVGLNLVKTQNGS